MHYYRYRWIYAISCSVFLSILFFINDIQPKLARITKLQVEKKAVLHALLMHKQLAKHSQITAANKITPVNESEFDTLHYLLTLIHLHGLSVQSVIWLSAHDALPADAKIIKVIMQGGFQQFVALMMALNTSQAFLFVRDFSLKLEKETELFTIEIIAPKHLTHEFTFPMTSPLPYLNDVLCLQPAFVSNELDDMKQAQSMRLATFKMVGFLERSHEKEALVLLPTQNVVPVKIGFVLGQEKATVIDIRADQITFALPNNKSWLLKM
ncbi:MAG: pilus assembly protein PilP [Gammaproteobacteria bacterium]|nr:pilus assembly protein PilP [Gammaproteobacteria bacterium]